MGLISEIIDKGYMHKDFPCLQPRMTLTKEQQDKLKLGEMIIVTDDYYQSDWLIRMSSSHLYKKTLDKNDLICDPLEKMDKNKVRQQELFDFYQKHPKYKS